MYNKGQVFKSNFVKVIYFFSLTLFLSCSDVNIETSGFKFYGKVVDSVTNVGLNRVLITIVSKDSTLRIFTDEDGHFLIDDLDKNYYKAHYLKYGYQVERGLPRNSYPKYGSLLIKLNPIISDIEKDSLYANSYSQGWAFAEDELSNNNVSIYGGGKSRGYPKLEEIIGLPVKLIHGCISTPELDFIIKGHNDRIFKYIGDHKIPLYRRLWKYQSSELILSFFRKNDNFSEGITLYEMNTKIVDTDSLYHITTSISSNYHTLFIETKDTLVSRTIPGSFNEPITFWWGPKDEQVAFLKTSKNHGVFYVIDLINFDLYLVSKSSSHLLK